METIRQVSYCYAMTSNKPGEGARLLETLRAAGVNLLLVHGFPSARKAQIDFVATDHATLAAAAKSAKVKLSRPKAAFLIEGDDEIGAVASVMGRLAAAKIGVTALTAVCAGMGRYGGVLWVAPRDVKRAGKALGAR
ncbi:MAG TPA: hypothetical protein VN848_13540 [Gemmatimonadales bacterium]|nr:hypothetical protein [Gemmatimonadales bacterium]